MITRLIVLANTVGYNHNDRMVSAFQGRGEKMGPHASGDPKQLLAIYILYTNLSLMQLNSSFSLGELRHTVKLKLTEALFRAILFFIAILQSGRRVMINLPNGYADDDISVIKSALTFENLVPVAFNVLTKLEPPVGMVCGPISATGGTKSVERNMGIFSGHIQLLESRGLKIFNQLPFEKTLWRIMQDTSYFKGGAHLLVAFYLPLFKSGMVKTLYFIPNWRSSFGAQWEHWQALILDLEIVYL